MHNKMAHSMCVSWLERVTTSHTNHNDRPSNLLINKKGRFIESHVVQTMTQLYLTKVISILIHSHMIFKGKGIHKFYSVLPGIV